MLTPKCRKRQIRSNGAVHARVHPRTIRGQMRHGSIGKVPADAEPKVGGRKKKTLVQTIFAILFSLNNARDSEGEKRRTGTRGAGGNGSRRRARSGDGWRGDLRRGGARRGGRDLPLPRRGAACGAAKNPCVCLVSARPRFFRGRASQPAGDETRTGRAETRTRRQVLYVSSQIGVWCCVWAPPLHQLLPPPCACSLNISVSPHVCSLLFSHLADFAPACKRWVFFL
jgi:hypothetical protein